MTSDGLQQMEARKKEEIDFHNRLRNKDLAKDPKLFKYYTSNYKFYAVDRANRKFCEDWIRERCASKRVLDYCCGDGDYSLLAARVAATTVGIDISDVAVHKCAERARTEGLDSKTSFHIRDAESTGFEDHAFDAIICAGVLHHLDLDRAYRELARLLAPGGEIICMEALGHNPLIQWYRRLTPHLRTAYEAKHILKMRDVHKAKKYFRKINVRFFHLATLLAVPFRNMPGFRGLLSFLEAVDSVLLLIPLVQKMAWMVTFTLGDPIKT
ncbi:MAG: methyltransferase domain-containing protein [Candidatus Omnitrophica bacterium]|nr:methyltransferase domain-containing protein [Candidatus Omnitrophota bacterium]